MSISQRIKCIREIADNLSSFDWSELDLVLGQFKLPTSDSWGSDRKAYVISHIKDATDATLKELHSYLTGEVKEEGITTAPAFPDEEKIWQVGKFRLFLSHLSSDKGIVSEVKENLNAYAIDGFVAHEDIDPTLEWQDVIESALQSCDALAAFLTEKFHESFWTDQEIGFAVARRMLVVPLKVGLNPYGFIGKFQAKNCADLPPSAIAKEIFNILIESPLTAAKMSESMVAHFVSSTTWESARARSLLLQRVKTWTPEMLRSIENGLTANSKIQEAWGVPEKIHAILAQHKQQ